MEVINATIDGMGWGGIGWRGRACAPGIITWMRGGLRWKRFRVGAMWLGTMGTYSVVPATVPDSQMDAKAVWTSPERCSGTTPGAFFNLLVNF